MPRIHKLAIFFGATATVFVLAVSLSQHAQAQSGSRNTYGNAPAQGYSGRVMQGSTTQGSTTQGSTSSNVAVPITQTYDQRLWSYLKASRYENWAPVPGQSDAAYAGESPHGAFLKMYLNRRAAGNPKNLPEGSLIIKENYGPDGKKLMAITAMVKAKGYNPSGADWYWVKFRPDGTVDRKVTPTGSSMALSGKPTGCIDCHSGAGGDDFLFFNDDM